MSQEKTIPGLGELLGTLPDDKPADLAAYRKLQALKRPPSLTDSDIARGFEDLLARRAQAKRGKTLRWPLYGAIAASALVAVSVTFMYLRPSAAAPEIVTAEVAGGKTKATGIEFPADRLVTAKIEDVDIQFRGVSGFSAISKNNELELKLDSGFLNVAYHPGPNRKKLTILTRGSSFSVTGTKFFIDATTGVRLVVTEGRVVAAKDGKIAEVTHAETWTAAHGRVQKLLPQQLNAYTSGFADTGKKPHELEAIAVAGTTPLAPPVQQRGPAVNRVRLHLGLGQIVSGTLVSEDAEAVNVTTSGGKTLRISRSEIEKIERLR